jgi:uncharacterized protein (TIGR03000 family)
MTSQLTRVLAALAAVAVVGWLGPQQARAQRGYPGGYAGDTGFTWAEVLRYNPVTNTFGARGWEPSRPSYPGRAVYTGSYPSAAAAASYYADTPLSDSVSSAHYPYGAYAPGAYAPSAPGNTARIRLIVPAGARVWFGNTAMSQTGAVRSFESPELTPGKSYGYDLTIRWLENGKEVTRRRHVGVSANSSVTADFTQP